MDFNLTEKEKLIKLLNLYKGHLNKKYTLIKFRNSYINPNTNNIQEAFGHMLWMIDEMYNMENSEKANRWLGFIQGVFWVTNEFTIDEMRDHNKDLIS